MDGCRNISVSIFFPPTSMKLSSNTELISLMAHQNECSRVSYFSGTLAIIVIVLFPLEDFRTCLEETKRQDHEICAP